uniref:Translin-associated factor X-interacting protein 1 N-terminal domain-containing protein n=1 Tax=Spongospora subterranea TaxID=70186 RepID=A0A0H5RSA3_9EUKA|eukprot:CRZ11619.1 hypothetical protein [Spongospora subterranea]
MTDRAHPHRYIRSYHTEAELELLHILQYNKELGCGRPHREILRPMLSILAKIATRVGPFQYAIERIISFVEGGIFDQNSRLMYYEVASHNRNDVNRINLENEGLNERIGQLRQTESLLGSTIDHLQNELADSHNLIRKQDSQIRNQSATIARLNELIASARETVILLEEDIQHGRRLNVMNSVLKRELSDLREQHSRQLKENVETLELLNKTNASNQALQQIVDDSVAKAKRLSASNNRRTGSIVISQRKPSATIEQAIRRRTMSINQVSLTTPQIPTEKAVEVPEDGSRTPRPDWQKISNRVHLTLTEIPTTMAVDLLVTTLAEKVGRIKMLEMEDMLGEEMAETDRAARLSYIGDKTQVVDGLGTGDEVPRYLRISGKVRRRQIGKRQTELIIREVWNMKRVYDRQRGSRSRLSDYFYTYLSTKHGATAALQEWGYSLVEAMKAFQYDADIQIFDMVLRGEVSEDIFEDQTAMVGKLLEACAAKDGARAGFIDKKMFVKVLLKQFPEKTMARMRFLVKAIEAESMFGNHVDYGKLFEENRDGDQGPFAEALRDQYLTEIIEYYQDLRHALEEIGREKEAKLSPEQIRVALRLVDKKIPRREIDRILEDVFDGPAKKLGKRTIDIDSIINTIKSKGVHRRYCRRKETEMAIPIADDEVDDSEASMTLENRIEPLDEGNWDSSDSEGGDNME